MKNASMQFISHKHIIWFILILVSVIVSLLSIIINHSFIIMTIIFIPILVLVIKYPFYGLIGYLIIFLMRPGEIFPAIAPLRLELLFGTLTMVIVLLHQKFTLGKIEIPNDKIFISIIGILVAISLSIFTSYEKTVTKDIAVSFVKIMVFFYLIISLVTSRKRFIIFIMTFIGLLFYIAADAFILYISGHFTHTMNVDRLAGSTSAGSDPNSLGATLVLSIPVIIATANYYKNFFAKVLLYFLSMFMTTMIVITASRSALLALLGIVFASIYYSKRKTLNILIAICLLIMGWFLLPQQYRDRYMRFSEIAENANDVSSGRIEIWLAGLRMIPARPILGVGAGAFAWAQISGEYGNRGFMQSHSLYLEIICTMGIVGTVAWLFFIITFYKRLVWLSHLKSSVNTNWIKLFSKCFIIVICGLLISGLFGHNLYRYTWYMSAGLTVALTNIWYKDRYKENISHG